MNSPKLDQYFKDTNPDDLQNRLEDILYFIDPKYVEDFNNYRKTILLTIEN